MSDCNSSQGRICFQMALMTLELVKAAWCCLAKMQMSLSTLKIPLGAWLHLIEAHMGNSQFFCSEPQRMPSHQERLGRCERNWSAGSHFSFPCCFRKMREAHYILSHSNNSCQELQLPAILTLSYGKEAHTNNGLPEIWNSQGSWKNGLWLQLNMRAQVP